MQFHLNGFHDGDPHVHETAPGHVAHPAAMPAEVDALIVGSGPAGLTLAAQLAAFPGIVTRIVDRRDGSMTRGQADGVSCRSMEMFNAFGFGNRAMEEGYWVNEVTFWMPDPEHPERITRVGRVQDVEDDLSEMPHVILNQARIHDFYLDVMRNSPSRLEVDYNVSMRDTFNLGWKLVSVLTGRSSPQLLHSYSAERRAVARDLIEFDHRWSRIMSAPPEDRGDGDGTPLVQEHFVAGGRFTAGLRVRYEPSALIGEPRWQALASGFEIGTRFHSAPAVRLADARPVQLGHVVKADACWHLFAFAGAGDPVAADSGIAALCDFLATSPDSPVRKHTPAGADVDSVISRRAVFQQDHRTLDLEAMPDLLRPPKGRYRLEDYEKVFCVDRASGRDAFDMRGVDRDEGCVVVVRPDQHVAHVLPLDARDRLSAFFAGFLLPAA